LIITDSNQAYLTFFQKDGKKEFEKKSDFRKVLKDPAYKIDNSKVDGNTVTEHLKELAERFGAQIRYVG
jgi:hypothetical protein